ncbi:hypothetical protein Quidividi_037 [Staphylococcus phage Quidividi]|nr:hypothetical protein Quidividi_037 [Staphylococcus phage Quidividi]
MDIKEFLEGQPKSEYKDKQKLKESIINTSIEITKVNLDDFRELEKLFDDLKEYIHILEINYGKETNIEIPSHYSGTKDVISFLEEQFTAEAFVSSMVFNIVKYTTRLGRKDEEEKEISKIKNYYLRLHNFFLTGDSLG